MRQIFSFSFQIFFVFFLIFTSDSLHAIQEEFNFNGKKQQTKKENINMQNRKKSESVADDLKNENQELREKLQEFKKLEEDLMAQRVYDKAKRRLISMITIGGIVLTIIGIMGIKSIFDYTKNLINKKLQSISTEQINDLIQEEGKKQVSLIVQEQQNELEAILVATAKQQINQIVLTSSPVGRREKLSISSESTQPTIDLTSFITPIRDQGAEGSTVGFAVAAALEYQIDKKLKRQVIISPRYLYYYAKLEGGFDPHSDTGAFVRDAIKVIKIKGAISEENWPYIPGDLKSKPPKDIDTAIHYKISNSYSLSNLDEIKHALQKHGPVVAGISLFSGSFSNKDVSKTGVLPDPSSDDEIRGGHAICIVGYDDDKKLIKFKNSWGSQWGDNGFGYLSYNYVNKFLTDAWTFTM